MNPINKDIKREHPPKKFYYSLDFKKINFEKDRCIIGRGEQGTSGGPYKRKYYWNFREDKLHSSEKISFLEYLEQ